MIQNATWLVVATALAVSCNSAPSAAAGQTVVSIEEGSWRLNGQPTYRGTKAEGLLMNVRMVNATFEDTKRSDFDADKITERFACQIPDYVAHGMRAFTLCLQGGKPGYEGAVNSAFRADGSLDDKYMQRVRRVIEACDRAGAVVILGCYYQRQDQILRDESAVRAGVVNVARWIVANGFQNVLLEVTNEFDHKGFDHRILDSVEGEVELLALAKRSAPGLLVSSSPSGHGRVPEKIAQVVDFLLVHYNGTPIDQIAPRAGVLKKYGKPIICNEDQKLGAEGARTIDACIAAGVSWGLMAEKHNQHFPFAFDGAADDPIVYARLKELTSAESAGTTVIDNYFPPPDSSGGWRTLPDAESVLTVAGIDRARLDEAFEFIKGSTKNGGLLVARKGWLVYEKYFGLGHREATPNLASCGKAFTSISVGTLLAERPDLFPDGLEQKIFTPVFLPSEAFPLTDPRKKDIKLGQLLAFTAGIRGNNPSYVNHKPLQIDPPGPDGSTSMADLIALGHQNGPPASNGTQLTTSTLWCEPGGGYSYATSSIHIGSIMLRHVTGQELQEYVSNRLAKPLGWGTWGYGYKNSKRLKHTPGGGGIELRGTDMLRFAYLLLREGRWNGQQIVPAEYIRHCSRTSPYNPHYDYSLQFDVNTNGRVPGAPRDAFWKSGSGGHVFYVVPSLDLVIWKLGGRDSQYSPEDTGLPVHPEAARNADPREGWKELVGANEAENKLLEMVTASVKDR